MPKTATPTQSLRRVTLNFPAEDYERLRAMAERRRITVTELLRRTVSLQAYLEEMFDGPCSEMFDKSPLTVALQHFR
jgi:hypothetical protein